MIPRPSSPEIRVTHDEPTYSLNEAEEDSRVDVENRVPIDSIMADPLETSFIHPVPHFAARYTPPFVPRPAFETRLDSPVLPVPDIPPLVPAVWPAQGFPWRNYTPPPPGPMVVPNMLSSETTPPFEPVPVPMMEEPTMRDESVHEESRVSVTPPLEYMSPLNPPVVSLPPAAPSSQLSPISVAPALATPEARLIDVDEHEAAPSRSSEAVGSSLDGMTTPSEVTETKAASVSSVPRLPLVGGNEWGDLWPELKNAFKHLLQPPSPPPMINHGMAMPGFIWTEEPQQALPEPRVEEVMTPSGDTFTTADDRMPRSESPVAPMLPPPPPPPPVHTEETFNPMTFVGSEPAVTIGVAPCGLRTQPLPSLQSPLPESPLGGEALLSRPEGAPAVSEQHRELHDVLSATLPPSPAAPLQASHVMDINIPDGQIFPPGAEFVKSWKMRNDGRGSWPESTELVFVAGDRLGPYDAVTKVKVGSVPAGEEVEIFGGEMKAPDIPGKYASYWRLHDGKETYFGHSLWVDILVVEMNDSNSDNSAESLASSVVIMPQPLDRNLTTVGSGEQSAPTSGPALSFTIPSGPPSEDGSFASSASLINVPSSPEDEEDDAAFEDSRSHIIESPLEHPRDLEYVVLYDTSSSESG